MDEDPYCGKGSGLYVIADNDMIGELAARYLLALELAHYAFVGWRRRRYWSEARQKAFIRSVHAYGGQCSLFSCPEATSANRRRELMTTWLKSLPRPCGIFAVHDPIGEDVLNAVDVAGFKVPDDFAVIGVDNDPIVCERTRPPLSSISIDFRQVGYMCAELLAERIDNPSLTATIRTYKPGMVVRRLSTRRFAHGDSRVMRGLEFIHRNACRLGGTSVDMVAAEMGLSRRMAEKVFRGQTGCSIHDEIVNVRLSEVERLLSNPRQDISAIANLCGWASDSVLRTAFRKRYGVSMREWRKNH